VKDTFLPIMAISS